MWMKVLWSITAWDQFCKTLHIKYSVFVIWWDSRANVLTLRRHLMRRSDSAKRLAGNRNCLTSTCGSVSLRLVRRTESGNFMPKNVCCSSALRVWSSGWNNTPSSQRTKLKKTFYEIDTAFDKTIADYVQRVWALYKEHIFESIFFTTGSTMTRNWFSF